MESIYILQKTYENLYALSAPIAEFLEKNLPCISPNWKRDCVDTVLEERISFDNRIGFQELDVYYLLVVLLDDRNWDALKELFPSDNFYSKENRDLLFRTKEIRNTVSHPRVGGYDENDFYNWENTLKETANLFGKNLGQLVADLHKSEKDRLFNFIAERTFDITMNSPHFKDLPQSKQKSIARTKQRLQDQTTAAGIMALFEDSYFLEKGQSIKKGLEEYNLPTFEDVMDDVRAFYYFGKEK